MQWDVFFVSVATSGVTSSLVTIIISWVRSALDEAKRKKSEAKYLAIQLVVILEKYASDCVYRQWHDEHRLKMGDTHLSYELPEIEAYPKEASHWKSLHENQPELAERSLLFPNRISSAKASAEFSGRCEGNHSAIYGEIIVTGWKALGLAKDLRNKFQMDVSPTREAEALEREYLNLEQRYAEFKKQWDASGWPKTSDNSIR